MKTPVGLRLIIMLPVVCLSILWGQDTPAKSIHLRLAVPLRNFDELSRKDALLAMDLWTDEIIRNTRETEGIEFTVESTFLVNSMEKVDFSNNQKYDILLLSALDFLDFGLSRDWQPIALTKSEGHFPEEYVLLVPAKSPAMNAGGLSAKHIIFAKNQDARIILFWLDTMLEDRYHRTTREYFAKVEETSSASRALLAVFFGKADACVVGYNQYATMVELNPQIKTQLKIIEWSSPFARGMVCLNKALEPQIKRIITQAVLDLPASDRGQQILRFFNQSDLLPYKSEYLDSFRAILEDVKNERGVAR